MAKKLSREELKRDEVLETFEKGFGYLSSHRKGSLEVAAGVVGTLLIVGLIAGVKSYRETNAAEHLSRALAILSTPLSGEVAPGQSPDKTYASDAERRAEADKDLALAGSFPGTRAGRQARALLAAERPGEAASLETLQGLAKRAKVGGVAGVAEIDVLRILAAKGRAAEAITRARSDIESSDTAAPKDALLMELARLYEASGSGSDARLTYQRLVRDYPNSPYTSEAQSKAGSL
jgi:hypothetical protein